MKILFLTHYESLSPRVKNEIKTLEMEGYNIITVCWNRTGIIHNNQQSDNQIIVSVKTPIGSLRILFFLPLFYIKSINILKDMDFDIIHCTHFYLLILAFILGKLKKAKIIYDAYEMFSYDFSAYVPKPFSEIVKKMIEIIENFLISKIDGVVTIDSIGNFLVRRYCRYNKNVVVIYNVPDIEIKLDLKKVKILENKYKGKKVLIYSGGIFEDKGSVKSLEALALVRKKYSNVKLIMIGNILDPPGKLEKLTKELGIEENVEFIPWLPYEEMFCYLKIAHIGLALYQPVGHFLFVSKGNGRKFFTYMQAGLPIVAPNFGEISLIVKEEKCGILVDTTDPREIANAIIYLLEHPEEAKAMGERGKKAVEEKYNWEIEKNKLIKLYKSLLINDE